MSTVRPGPVVLGGDSVFPLQGDVTGQSNDADVVAVTDIVDGQLPITHIADDSIVVRMHDRIQGAHIMFFDDGRAVTDDTGEAYFIGAQ